MREIQFHLCWFSVLLLVILIPSYSYTPLPTLNKNTVRKPFHSNISVPFYSNCQHQNGEEWGFISPFYSKWTMSFVIWKGKKEKMRLAKCAKGTKIPGLAIARSSSHSIIDRREISGAVLCYRKIKHFPEVWVGSALGCGASGLEAAAGSCGGDEVGRQGENEKKQWSGGILSTWTWLTVFGTYWSSSSIHITRAFC